MGDVSRRRALGGLGGLALAAYGCNGQQTARQSDSSNAPESQVVVYAALDEEFSKPILRIYQQKSGVNVRPIFDVESTKSFGLAGRIMSEAESPTCDLFWNNEILNTVRLKEKNLIEPFHPHGCESIPAPFKDTTDHWYGFAARARILLVNTAILAEPERPRGLHDLIDPKWKSKAGIAKPLFGTTGTHAACLFAAWGEAKAKEYFYALKNNDVAILSGNRQVAAEVAAGRLAFGLTDTDDALLEVTAGSPVAIVYPDREAGQLGTLFIPNTLARVKGCRHPDQADSLAAYLLSAQVEKALALGPSGQIPLNPAVDVKLQVETPKTVHPMRVDFDKAAALWEPVVAPFLVEQFAEIE